MERDKKRHRIGFVRAGKAKNKQLCVKKETYIEDRIEHVLVNGFV